MIPRGVSEKCSRTSALMRFSSILAVSKVSTSTDTGSATPMA